MNTRLALSLSLSIVVGAALTVAACGGEATDPEAGGTPPTALTPGDSEGENTPLNTEAADSETDKAPPTALTPGDSEGENTPLNTFDDPRDGPFDEFQASLSRGDHPFMQVYEFCNAHDAAPDRVATDKGIEADTIKITHIRTKLEDLADIGFGTDVGDPAEMFETFAAYVNEQCGGVRGRMIDLHTIDVDVLGVNVDDIRNAACIEAIEDHDAVIIVNSSGFEGSAALCIVEANETAFITVQPQPDEFMERSGDRLITMTPTAEESLRWLALDLIGRGDLDGRTVGIAAPDTPGQYEAVEAGLVNVLGDNGIDVAVFDKIGCSGALMCGEGTIESVSRMRAAGVDVIFNVLNAISAPLFLTEMLNQGFEPGDVQFYASDFNSQATEIVSQKIVQFGGAEVGALYDGARIMDSRNTGAYQFEDYEPTAFDQMCNDTYGANSPSGANHESEDRHDGNSRYGMTNEVCSIMRTALRAIYDAGDNPTRADIHAALANLGPIDTNEMIPGSIRPGKTRVPDTIHSLVFEFPCTKPYGLPVPGLEDTAGTTCIYPIDEYRPTPDRVQNP